MGLRQGVQTISVQQNQEIIPHLEDQEHSGDTEADEATLHYAFSFEEIEFKGKDRTLDELLNVRI